MNTHWLQGLTCQFGSEGPFPIMVSALATVTDDGTEDVSGGPMSATDIDGLCSRLAGAARTPSGWRACRRSYGEDSRAAECAAVSRSHAASSPRMSRLACSCVMGFLGTADPLLP